MLTFAGVRAAHSPRTPSIFTGLSLSTRLARSVPGIASFTGDEPDEFEPPSASKPPWAATVLPIERSGAAAFRASFGFVPPAPHAVARAETRRALRSRRKGTLRMNRQ